MSEFQYSSAGDEYGLEPSELPAPEVGIYAFAEEIAAVGITSPSDIRPDEHDSYDYRRPDRILSGPQEEIAAVIDDAAQEAYELFSDVTGLSPDVIRQQAGQCEYMSIVLQQLAAIRGLTLQLRRFDVGGGAAHYLLQSQTGMPEQDVRVDPTWQQMIEFWDDNPAYGDLPDVLIVPVLQPERALLAHGIPPHEHSFWMSNDPHIWSPEHASFEVRQALVKIYRRYPEAGII